MKKSKRTAAKTKPPAKSKTVLVLRTCDENMRSHGGFQWPESGRVVAPDWNPKAQFGNGLHGWLWGSGDWALKTSGSAIWWLVVEVERAGIVDIGGKVKFEAGEVVFRGKQWSEAMAFIRGRAGYTAESSATGDYGHASATGDYGHASASGYSGHASATGDYGHASASGYYGWACTGRNGAAKAGIDGTISILWWDGKRNRLAVGYVGEDGIKADTLYQVVSGKLREVLP
jgi:hypothetical protein